MCNCGGNCGCGDCCKQLAIGAAAALGLNGTPGSLWYFGTGAPSGSLGNVNDAYLDTASGNIYQKTGLTTWTLVGNLAGASGGRWYTGSGAPSGATGVVNDMYLDTTAFNIYQKTGSSTWTLQCNIKGAAGTNGVIRKGFANGVSGNTSSADAIVAPVSLAGGTLVNAGDEIQASVIFENLDNHSFDYTNQEFVKLNISYNAGANNVNVSSGLYLFQFLGDAISYKVKLQYDGTNVVLSWDVMFKSSTISGELLITNMDITKAIVINPTVNNTINTTPSGYVAVRKNDVILIPS